MSAITTNYVRSGQWTDYSRGYWSQLQYLTGTSDSQIWTNAIAIYLTLLLNWAAFVLFLWILRMLRSACPRWQSLTDIIDVLEEAGDCLHGIRNIFVLQVLQHPQPPPPGSSMGWSAIKENLRKVREQWRQSKSLVITAGVLIIALFLWVVAFNAAFAFVAGISSEGTGISDSPGCDIWQTRVGASMRNWESKAEYRARFYAEQCFGKPTGTDGCNLYVNQSISFVETNVSCPFQEGACDSTGGPAVAFDTGYFDSKTLGINIKNSHIIRRRSICSPVATDERYVRYHTAPYGLRAAEYYYGNVQPDGRSWNGIDSEFTYNSSVTFTKDTPSYSLASFRSKSVGQQAFVLPEFRVPNHTITLLIIEEGLIFHLEERQDPVFPAHNHTTFNSPLTGQPLWYNGVHHGGVLMCADQHEICTPDRRTCWSSENAPNPFSQNATRPSDDDLAYALLWHALLNSNTHASISQSQSYGLDAQRHVNQLLSTELAAQQWVVEARLLFRNSLARWLQDLHDIQRGSAAGEPGFTRSLPQNYRGLCRIYKFKTTGWTNVSVWWTVLCTVGGFLIWIGFRRWSDKFIIVRCLTGGGYLIKFVLWTVPILVWKRLKIAFDYVESLF